MILSTFLSTVYVPSRLTLAAITIEQYEIICRSIERHYGRPIRTGELSDAVVTAWLSARMAQVAPKTVSRERAGILALWRLAHERGLSTEYPCRIPHVKVPRRLPTYWRIDELGRLLATCKAMPGTLGETGIRQSDFWTSLVLFLYDSATRLGAALAVTPQEVDLPHRQVVLRASVAKTGIEQLCTISPQTAEAIEPIYDPARQFVWPWPWARRQIFPHFKAILVAANLPHDRYRMFHCLRRTCATLTAAASTIDVARRALGHTNEAMTRRYVNESALPRVTASDVLPRPKF